MSASVVSTLAQVAELVDALGSGPSGGNTVEVRVLSWAPDHRKTRSAFKPCGFFVFAADFPSQIRQLALLAWRHCVPRCHTCERTGFFPSAKPRTVPRAAAEPQRNGN